MSNAELKEQEQDSFVVALDKVNPVMPYAGHCTALTAEDSADAEIKKLVSEHWAYMEKLLAVHGEVPANMDRIKFHYQSAFAHGWKHALEYTAAHRSGTGLSHLR